MTKSETNNDMDEKMANLRAKKKPAKLSNIDQSVLDLPVGKQQQNMRSENQKLKDEGMRTRLDAEAYIRSMKKYLNSGDWSSLYYGEYEDKLIEWKVVAPSYK